MSIEDKGRPLFQQNLAFFELLNAYLGALQVTQYANLTTMGTSPVADPFCTFDMFFRGAVGKVNPHNIDTGLDDLVQHLGVIGRRTESSDNLCSS